MRIRIAGGRKIFKCCLHFFNFNLSSPTVIATGTALHAIRRFRRQHCRRRGALIHINTVHFIDVFSEFFFCVQRGRGLFHHLLWQAHAKTYVTLFKRITCPLLFQYQVLFCCLQKGIRYCIVPHAKTPKSAKIKEYCMRLSNLRVACNADNVSKIPLG